MGIRVVSVEGQPITPLPGHLAKHPPRGRCPAAVVLPGRPAGGDAATTVSSGWAIWPAARWWWSRSGSGSARSLRTGEPEAIRPAALIPPSFQPSRSLARALAAYVERRRMFPWGRRMEIARHLGEPLRQKFQLPAEHRSRPVAVRPVSPRVHRRPRDERPWQSRRSSSRAVPLSSSPTQHSWKNAEQWINETTADTEATEKDVKEGSQIITDEGSIRGLSKLAVFICDSRSPPCPTWLRGEMPRGVISDESRRPAGIAAGAVAGAGAALRADGGPFAAADARRRGRALLGARTAPPAPTWRWPTPTSFRRPRSTTCTSSSAGRTTSSIAAEAFNFRDWFRELFVVVPRRLLRRPLPVAGDGRSSGACFCWPAAMAYSTPGLRRAACSARSR